MEVDPQILFRLHGEAYLGRLKFVPKKVDVLEIYHYTVGVLFFLLSGFKESDSML